MSLQILFILTPKSKLPVDKTKIQGGLFNDIP